MLPDSLTTDCVANYTIMKIDDDFIFTCDLPSSIMDNSICFMYVLPQYQALFHTEYFCLE